MFKTLPWWRKRKIRKAYEKAAGKGSSSLTDTIKGIWSEMVYIFTGKKTTAETAEEPALDQLDVDFINALEVQTKVYGLRIFSSGVSVCLI